MFQHRAPSETVWLDDECVVEVVGESHYQPALRHICGSEEWDEVCVKADALLVPEPSNRYDANAIQVQVRGHVVGYLSRTDAVAYGPLVRRLGAVGRLGACKAVIAGRGVGGETSNLGVFLHLCEPA